MTAIWHDPGGSKLFSPGPEFSFIDIAEIVQPAPASYRVALERYRLFRMKMGNAFFDRNLELANIFWAQKRPWWLSL